MTTPARDTLRLRFACTKQEQDEAQSLSIRKQLGVGSQLGAMVVLLAIIVGVYAMMWFTIPRPFRYYVVGFAAVATVVATIHQRRAARNPREVDIHLTPDEIRIGGDAPNASVLRWSTFVRHIESENLFVLV